MPSMACVSCLVLFFFKSKVPSRHYCRTVSLRNWRYMVFRIFRFEAAVTDMRVIRLCLKIYYNDDYRKKDLKKS
ncbi:hypothetical protein BDZ91DRAFT_717148 [Kalaharituber pfeilii]|nr:hypothetical protein BDZ91DRAFT_717148 [Kalaharituber pfeilii]